MGCRGVARFSAPDRSSRDRTAEADEPNAVVDFLGVGTVMAVPVFLKSLGWSWFKWILDLGRWAVLLIGLVFVIARP